MTVRCACGCGQPTPIATKTYTKYGIRKGEPWRYIQGHSSRIAPVGERMARFISVQGECHLWTGHTAGNGYGSIRTEDGPRYAHRVAWELANGPIPDGLYVLHRCDTPRCVNPAHLFLGTAKDNSDDCWRKGRGVTPTVPRKAA